MDVTIIKCPPDFLLVGHTNWIGQVSEAHWVYPDRRNLTGTAIARCMEHITWPMYSDRLRERFEAAAAEAIPFVTRRTLQQAPMRIGLIRFTKLGQRCVVMTVDSVPLPGLHLHLPDPDDPDLRQPNLKRHYTHARIWRAVDGYAVSSDEQVLQLSLSWAEPVRSSADDHAPA